MTADAAKLFRERLRSLRDAKGLSQTELEERIGKEANYICASKPAGSELLLLMSSPQWLTRWMSP